MLHDHRIMSDNNITKRQHLFKNNITTGTVAQQNASSFISVKLWFMHFTHGLSPVAENEV